MRLDMRHAIVSLLDPWFPPDPAANMTPAQISTHEVEKAPESMGRYLTRLGRTDVDVLDFGCGWGGETLWLADHVRSVVGVDIDPDNIAQAHRVHAARAAGNCRFVQSTEQHLPLPDASVDAVFSTNTFEHVQDLPSAFAELYRVLRPWGWLIASWAPLFYSPHGYHLYWACQVPYAHLIGGFHSVSQLREARSGTPTRATTWAEMGLNMRRFRDFYRAAQGAGFNMQQFERLPVRGLHRLARLPVVGDLLTLGVECAIQKPAR